MSRWEFLRKLEELLSDISPSEREEALQYYNDYFNDAGRENEDEVMKALGSPEQVARIVKDGLGDNENLGEFTENGFSNAEGEKKNEVSRRVSSNDSDAGKEENKENKENFTQGNANQTAGAAAAENKKEDMPTWAIVLIVIGCIIFSPAILGVIAAAFGVILSFVVAVFAVVLGFALGAAILLVVAFSLWIAGFGCLFIEPLIGAGLIGGGLICAALGILFMLLTVFLAGKCIPGIFQGLGYIFHKIFGTKGGKKA